MRDLASVAGCWSILVKAEAEGLDDVRAYVRDPSVLPSSHLGAFGECDLMVQAARRLLAGLPTRLWPLALVGGPPGLANALFRWRRFLTECAYWKGVRRGAPSNDFWHRLVNGPVILAYHAVARDGEAPSPYVISAGDFARQMAWLKGRAYRVISLEELIRYRREDRLPPARSVVITFDDGYADNFQTAYPILRRYGFPATIFVVTGAIGTVNTWDRSGDVLAGRPLLSWNEIRAMPEVSFGVHTRTHRRLTHVLPSELREEIDGSRRDLETHLRKPVTAFAYPHGAYNQSVEARVKAAGFIAACTVDAGITSPGVSDYLLRRAVVYGHKSFFYFLLALATGRTQPPLPMSALTKRLHRSSSVVSDRAVPGDASSQDLSAGDS